METISPTSPEQSAKKQRENAFRLEQVEALRHAQRDMYTPLYEQYDQRLIDDTDFETAVQEMIQNSITEYATGYGIDMSDEDNTQFIETLRELSYDRISDTSWRNGEWTNEEKSELGKTGPTLLAEAQVSLFGKNLDADVDSPDIETSEAEERHEALRASLNEKRTKLAQIASKRQGKAISFKRKEYDEARAEYNDHLTALGRFEVEQAITQDLSLSQEDKNKIAIAYILDDYAKLRAETNEVNKNVTFRKFTKAVGEYFTKGSKLKRIVKGAAAGAGTSALLMLALPAGIAAGTATAVGVGVSRLVSMARMYASRDARENHAMQERNSEDDVAKATEKLEGDNNLVFRASQHADTLFDQDTTQEQAKRRRSVALSLGAIAAGSIAAYGVHEIVSNWNSSGSSAQPITGTPDSTTPHTPGQPGVGGVDTDPNTGGNSGGSVGHEHTHGTPLEMDDGKDGGSGPIKSGVGAPPDSGPDGSGPDHTPGNNSGTKPEAVGHEVGRSDLFDGSKSTTEFTSEGMKDFNKYIDKYQVKSGDSIWKISERYLESKGIKEPSIYQIDAAKDKILANFQAKGIADARGWLNAGDIISTSTK